MTSSQFMARLTQALKHKAGIQGPELTRTVRRIYGLAAPLIKKHPASMAPLSAQIDRLTPGQTLARYVPQVQAIIADMRQDRRRVDGQTRGQASGASIGDILQVAHARVLTQPRKGCAEP